MIRFVYFDLGNVLAAFDPGRGCRNVSARWGVDQASVHREVWDSGLQQQFELGTIGSESFAAAVRRRLGLPVAAAPTAELLDRLSDMFEPVAGMAELVDQVRQVGLPVGILSNTCAAHWSWLRRQRYPALQGPLASVILSYEVGVLKPQAGIYAAAQRGAAVAADQLLFLDDRPEHVAAARDAGWHAERFTDAAQAHQWLRLMGILDRSSC